MANTKNHKPIVNYKKAARLGFEPAQQWLNNSGYEW